MRPDRRPLKEMMFYGKPGVNRKMREQLVFEDADYKKVRRGDRTFTIRDGERPLPFDRCIKAVSIDDPDGGIPVQVVSTEYMAFRLVPMRLIKLAGHVTHESCLDDMRSYYPDITLDSIVTVVRFAVSPKGTIEKLEFTT
jgi:hypothetical protein